MGTGFLIFNSLNSHFEGFDSHTRTRQAWLQAISLPSFEGLGACTALDSIGVGLKAGFGASSNSASTTCWGVPKTLIRSL